jgi:fermentation-respiration switch protein FrsA (DUF1100 family)
LHRHVLRLTVLAAALLAAFIGAVFWAGNVLTQHARAPTGSPPAEFGARALRFASASGTTLSAWFVPGERGRGAVLLLHPIRANKRTMLPRARFLQRAGYAVLLVDLQAHGESDGERITFGLREADDVRAAADRLRALAHGEKLGVIGVSLGAAAFVLSDTQGAFAAAVLESLYPTVEEAVANRLRLKLGPPGPWLAPLLLMQIEPRLGITPLALRPIDRIARLRAPLLMVHGAEDRHTTLAQAQRLFALAPQPKEIYIVAGAAHVDLHDFAASVYEQRILGFLARHLR